MVHEAVVGQKQNVSLSTSSQEQPFVSQDAQVELKNKTKAANAKKTLDKGGRENQSDEKAIEEPAASENKIAGTEDQKDDTDVDAEDLSLESPEEEKEEDDKEPRETKPKGKISQSSKDAAIGKGKAKAKAKSIAEAKSKAKAEVKSKAKAKAKAQSSAGSNAAGNEERALNTKKRKWDFGIEIPKFKTCQVVVYGSRNEVGVKLKEECVEDDGKRQARLIILCSKSDFFKAC